MRVLVIDDEESNHRLLQKILLPAGFDVIAASDGLSGLARVAADKPDVVLLDLNMPQLDGLGVLEQLRAGASDIPVIMLTGDTLIRSAVRATQLGAFDYLTKPIDQGEVVRVVRRAVETRVLKAEVADLRRQLGEGGGLAAQMGNSLPVREVIEQVQTVAASNFSVLILGETGTGKDLVSQAIHRQSERRNKPFVAIDCGAIPEALLESELFGHEKGSFTGADRRKKGHFQLAEGGTVFLDEIGNLPLGLQAKLLRALESRQVMAVGATDSTPMDVRFLAATNDELQTRVKQGQFRADLYFRLAQYTISLPPLRERVEDIPHLAQRFLEEVSIELKRPVREISAEAMQLLMAHDWSGNVRELRNIIRQSVLEAKDVVLHQASVRRFLGRGTGPVPTVKVTSTAGRSLKIAAEEAAREAERRAICEALREARGNKSQAARALQTDFKTLHIKMKHLGIQQHDFASA